MYRGRLQIWKVLTLRLLLGLLVALRRCVMEHLHLWRGPMDEVSRLLMEMNVSDMHVNDARLSVEQSREIRTVRSCRSNKSRRTKVLLHFMHLNGRSLVSRMVISMDVVIKAVQYRKATTIATIMQGQ